ncbi:MAG: DoxX family protein [Deltaproteobacteria bacterium]|nr:DoxX family protein [Deltaproteobacteria bacterium]
MQCTKSFKCFITDCECFAPLATVIGTPLLFLLRLYFGWQFFMAGKGKLVNPEQVAGFFQTLSIPLPQVSAYLVGSVEMIGGILLLLGLASRLAAVPLAITMIVAYLTAHIDTVKNIFADPKALMVEEPFLFLLTLLFVLAFGPGKLSLDYFFAKRCCKEDDACCSTGGSCCSS